MEGWVVTVRGTDTAGQQIMRVYEIGLDSLPMAMSAVKITHPELAGCHVQANGKLSATAVAYLELRSGEVRERHGTWSLDSSPSGVSNS